jgi:hypothetical protein
LSPAFADTTEISALTPSYIYQNQESVLLIYGSGFPNPYISLAVSGATVTELRPISEQLLLAKIVSPIAGLTQVMVNANGQVVVSPIDVEIRPKPADPETILREAKERMQQVTDRFTMLALEDTRKVSMAMNAAHSRKAVSALYDSYSDTSLRHCLVVLSFGVEDIWAVAVSDIQAAGGGPELIADIGEFCARSVRRVESFRDYLAAYASTCSKEFQQAPPPALAQAKLPFESDFRLRGPEGTPLNTTSVQLPPELGVGTADTEVTGTMRLRFVPSPNPEIAVFTVLSTQFVGTPLVVGQFNFGHLQLFQDPNNLSAGALNLRTGEIILSERYLVTSPILQLSGLSPVPIEFESKGVLYPMSHFLLSVITGDRSNSQSHTTDISGFLVFGQGTIPPGVPVIGGQTALILTEGCAGKQKPSAPQATVAIEIEGGSFDKRSKIWSVPTNAIPFTYIVTATPAAGTTAQTGSQDDVFSPPDNYNAKFTPGLANKNFPVKPSNVNIIPTPTPCVYMTILLEIVVPETAQYKKTQWQTETRIHFVSP